MKLAAVFLYGTIVCAGCDGKKDGGVVDDSALDSVVISADYKKGEALLGVKSDSAFYWFNKVVGSEKDSLQLAKAYNHMAAIQFDAGDYFGAQESLLSSLKSLNEHNPKHYYCLSSDYNELGNTSHNLRNYDAAIGYFIKAIQFAQDTGFKAVFVNNQALNYQKKKQYTRALELYRSIIDQSKADPKRYARVLTNTAMTKWLQDSSYNAESELLTALHIRENEKDEWGLNSSYGHLADYYFHSRPAASLQYAEQLYSIAGRLRSPDDELEALQKLIPLRSGKNVKPLFKRYQLLQDSLQTARNNAKNQFALIRYDAEKNKADNLELQKDNSEKKLQIIRQRVGLYSFVFILFLGAAFTIRWYRKRKLKMEREAQQKIRESQLRTSQKVHDVVANGLYRIMNEIEYKENLVKEELLDRIDTLYEKSRDISYEQPLVTDDSYDTTITSLLTSFASPATKILITGNNNEMWTNVSAKNKQELQLVLEELMVNMKKHSNAKNIVIKFERQDKKVNIQYADDGVGFSPTAVNGNGLVNTGNRMKAMGGSIIFDKSAGKGFKARLYFPINHP